MSLFMRSLLYSWFLCFITSFFALSNSAIAQSPATPPSELDRLQYFEGSWRCQQPAAPQEPTGVFIWTVQRDLNDFWYLGNAKEIELLEEREPINSREFLGYDAVSQELLRYVVVGNGNSFNFTATDWQEGILVWEGAVIDGGKLRALKEEIVRENKDRFTATYFVLDEAGEWQPVVDETCDRIEAESP